MGLVNNKKQIQLSRGKTYDESIKLDLVEADVLSIITCIILHDLFNISKFEYFEYKTVAMGQNNKFKTTISQFINNKITNEDWIAFYDVIGILTMFNDLYFKINWPTRCVLRSDECGFIYNILSNNTEITRCKDYDIFLRHLHNCYLLNDENLYMRINIDEN